ncbi:MAG TPA: Wzt carbohydrate-binding domain-containing protein, partial [Candidatus Dojkabacteria bacterium]|nr:Wzt carbohydrate-binding domain-containing protein [Candidatus Dojkabacteria bacterium]
FLNNIINEKLLEPNIIVGIVFENKKNIMISGCNTFESGISIDPRNKSSVNIKFEVRMPDLAPEEYFVSPAIAIGTQLHHQVLNWSNVVVELRSLPKRKYYFGIQYFDAKISIKDN